MNSAFQVLLKEFSVSKGITAEGSSYGLEFECEGHTVMVIQHPSDDAYLMLDVSVIALDPEPPAAQLAMMLQMNEAARFEHGWSAVMDSDMQVSVAASEPLQGLTIARLESLMLEGVERAQALAAILLDEVFDENSPPAESQIATRGEASVQMLRG